MLPSGVGKDCVLKLVLADLYKMSLTSYSNLAYGTVSSPSG